jgi:antirestriction protein ArdC
MNGTTMAAAPITLTAENTKGRLKEITDRLEAGIRDIFGSDQYKTYLNTLSKFHSYSFNNCVLIAMQKPDATHIAGYSAWQHNFKRQVMKGEKGIKIIAPAPYKIKKERERIDPKSGSVVTGKDGKPVMDEVEVKVPAFKVATVFDISQTEGEPLPEIGVDELSGDVGRYDDLYKALEKSSPVPIALEDIASGAKGYYEQVEKRIAIQSGMSELQTLKTAIHEIAHARLHDIDKNAPKDVPRPDHDTREVEAESVAYTVCAHYGLDTSDYSFGYIAGWSGDKELDTLKASLETIRSEAGAIITEVNGHMAQLAKDREALAMAGLSAEVEATLQFFVDRDMKDKGQLSQSTLETIRVQGYAMQDGRVTPTAAAPAAVPGHDTEGVWCLDGGEYLYVQTCEDGWDYTLYTPGFQEIDGGQLDEPHLSLAADRDKILALHELRPSEVKALSASVFEEARELAWQPLAAGGKLVPAAAAAVPPEKQNPLKTAEMSTEQNLNMIDGTLGNNTPTVAEIEARAKSGETVSLSELAGAMKAERGAEGKATSRVADERPSIREQLRAGKEQIARERPEQRAVAPHSRDASERA